MSAAAISLPVAFAAGLLFFFSPCVWPLYPAYLTYLTGASTQDLRNPTTGLRFRVLIQSLGFIVGFSFVFVALGATASLLGQFLTEYQVAFRKVSGVAIIVFGAYMLGLLPEWLFGSTRQIQYQPKGGSFFGAVGMGLAFGFGWTPCVGPILAGILVYASTTATVGQGMLLLTVYAAGFAIPFFLLALFFHRLQPRLVKLRKYLPVAMKASGVLLIALGILVYTNYLTAISWGLYYFFY